MAYRFRLRSLLVWIAVAALMLALIVIGNKWTSSAASTLAVFLLACAVPISLISRASTRAFWLGFGLVGWFFFFMAHHALGFLELHSNMLITQQALDEMVRSMGQNERGFYVHLAATEVCVLLLGLLGGLVCRWVYNRQAGVDAGSSL